MGVTSQHLKIVFYKNGTEIDSTQSFKSFDIDFGLGVATEDYVGRLKPLVRGTSGPVSLSGQMDFPAALKDGTTTYIDIAKSQDDKNKGKDTALSVDVIAQLDLGGTIVSMHFADCTISGLTLSSSGRTNFISTNPTFTSSEWKKLA